MAYKRARITSVRLRPVRPDGWPGNLGYPAINYFLFAFTREHKRVDRAAGKTFLLHMGVQHQ